VLGEKLGKFLRTKADYHGLIYVESKKNNVKQHRAPSPTGDQARPQSKVISDAPAFCYFQQCPAKSKKIAGDRREKTVTDGWSDFSGWEIAAKQ
jgi:hypothetical protein